MLIIYICIYVSPCVEIAGCRGDCTRPRDLQGTETFVLGSLFDRSRGTKISVLGRVFSGVQSGLLYIRRL